MHSLQSQSNTAECLPSHLDMSLTFQSATLPFGVVTVITIPNRTVCLECFVFNWTLRVKSLAQRMVQGKCFNLSVGNLHYWDWWIALGSLRAEQSLLWLDGDFGFFHSACLDFLPAGLLKGGEMEALQPERRLPTSFQWSACPTLAPGCLSGFLWTKSATGQYVDAWGAVGVSSSLEESGRGGAGERSTVGFTHKLLYRP